MSKRSTPVALLTAAVLAVAGASAAPAVACTTQHSSVYVHLSMASYPQTTDHILDAEDAGQPSLLHIDRADADEHRAESLANFPTRSGFDRDEYPPAASAEGGYGADVRYIDPSDNRGAGSTMGSQLSAYCENQPFRFDITS